MKRITIIGGGASGTLLAIHLLRYQGDKRVEINLAERRATIGRGVAFSSEHDVHLLNVPAAKMGAFADDVEHFHRWLQDKGHDYGPNAFVPRKLFGEYMRTTLEIAAENAKSSVSLNFYDDEAVDVVLDDTGGNASVNERASTTPSADHPADEASAPLLKPGGELDPATPPQTRRGANGKAQVIFASGDIMYSEAVVLAFGNFNPPEPNVADRAFLNAPKYFGDPWSQEAEERIEADDTVLIIGTGLSMADVVMRLNQRGHRGKIIAISTRGMLPAVHELGFTFPSFYEDLKGATQITDILKTVRRQIKIAESDGSNWRAVIDSLRPHTQQIWLDLPLAEKRYFMQHLSRYWNVARHRMPPEAAQVIDELRGIGQLQILKGRLHSITWEDDVGFNVRYTTIGLDQRVRVDAIVNCIGSQSNFVKLDSLLVKNLLTSGAIRCDDLNFGLQATPEGTLIGADGSPSNLFFTLGTALKGVLWESTAIPEIRVQARDLAERLLQN